jgi:hypothetical protein
MYQDSLRLFLPSFMITFLGIIFIWEFVRKRKNSSHKVQFDDNRILKKITQIGFLYKLILVFLSVAGISFAYLPEYYRFLLPIEPLDHPIINGIGILMLKISMIWIIIAQVLIDKELFKLKEKITDINTTKLFFYSQRALMSGLLLLFISFSVTISSVIAILICIIAYVLYKIYLGNAKGNSIKRYYIF